MNLCLIKTAIEAPCAHKNLKQAASCLCLSASENKPLSFVRVLGFILLPLSGFGCFLSVGAHCSSFSLLAFRFFCFHVFIWPITSCKAHKLFHTLQVNFLKSTENLVFMKTQAKHFSLFCLCTYFMLYLYLFVIIFAEIDSKWYFLRKKAKFCWLMIDL